VKEYKPYVVTFYHHGDASVGIGGESTEVVFDNIWYSWDEREIRECIEGTFLPAFESYFDFKTYYLLPGECDD
jgi:hypothetical protein